MPVNLSPDQIEILKAERQALLEELHSDEHYENTETITYGSHDPFDIPTLKCDICRSSGEMVREERANGSSKYYVRCTGCGNYIKTVSNNPSQATLLWNMINTNGLRYCDFPMFGLSTLTPEQAKKRMIGIRRNLEIRENLASLEAKLNPIMDKRPPANMYQKRLKLYLHWSMWAQAAIRVELPQKYRKLKHSR